MSRRRNVVLVPTPFQGHITPMLQLGSILESKGFSIIVAHSEYNAPKPLNHSSFTFLSFHDGIDEYDKSFENVSHVFDAININCKSPLHDYLVQLVKNEEVNGEVACIIYDDFMSFVDNVASSLKLPTIVMRAFGAVYSRACHVYVDLRSENCLPLSESRIGETMPDFHPFKFRDMPFPLSNVMTDREFEAWKIPYKIGSSRAIIWNTTDELEDQHLSILRKIYQVPIFSIGPFHKMAPPSKTSLIEEDNSCIEWLDKQAPNSVLYISLGSIVAMEEKEVLETAWGLINSEISFLWVIRDNSVHGSKANPQLPDELKEMIGNRGRIVKWAPQKKVLEHFAVGGFWSHCGWNSILEGISEGVPMICMPDLYDQFVNARYVTDVWNVGLQMERPVNRDNVAKIVKGLMGISQGNELREKAGNMKQQFQDSVKEGGSSSLRLNELVEFISMLS